MDERLSKRALRRTNDEDLSPKRRREVVDEKICQRSGKWTPEEETFANRLILEFESGILDDCEDGVTLRSYLARRLHCAPMRISKKFAGRCIGKVFKINGWIKN